MSKVPMLRFPEFSEIWNEEKLENIVEFHKGKELSKANLSGSGNGFPCILYGELYTKYKEVITNVESKTDYNGKEKLFLSKNNDVLIPSSGETAEDIASGTATILLDDIALGGDINVLRPYQNIIIGTFLSYSLNYPKQKDVQKIAQGASIIHLYASTLKNLVISIPTLEEQTKIANFLSLVDSKIEKQDQKVESLEEYKKGLMQKIFSQEIRFKDENGNEYPEWEYTKLNELAIKITDKNSDYSVRNVITNSAKKGLVKQRDYFDKDIANEANIDGYYVIKRNDFVYNPRKSSESPYGPIKMFADNEKGIVSPLYLCFRVTDDTSCSFLSYYFQSNVWHRYIYLNCDRGARHDRVSMKDSVFFNMDLYLPNKTEQTKIANFLSLFDQKIDKEKEKLDALRELKKGLLQQMFV